MTEEKKHDDKDREKVSDEKMEDVAGGLTGGTNHRRERRAIEEQTREEIGNRNE